MTDKGLSSIANLSDLRVLALDDTAISDVGLMSLQGLQPLMSVSIRRTQITDAGISNMCWLRNLSHAYCDSTNITNRGLLELVNRCSKLQEISVVNCKISDRMIVQLLAARPDVHISQ